jgi:hypothetical protein
VRSGSHPESRQWEIDTAIIYFLHHSRKYFARAMGSSPDSAFDQGIFPLLSVGSSRCDDRIISALARGTGEPLPIKIANHAVFPLF